MFDISFSQIMVILVVILLVVQPQRMPDVARKIGELIGGIRHQVREFKGELSKNVELEKLKELRDEIKQ